MASTPHYISRFEAQARALKVAKLVATARGLNHVNPYVTDMVYPPLVTARAVAGDPATRARLTRLSGVHEPSDETWRTVVRALVDLERLDETTGACA